MSLVVSEDRVLELASQDQSKRKVLEELFPDLLSSASLSGPASLSVRIKCGVNAHGKPRFVDEDKNTLLETREHGEYKGKGFYLGNAYEWSIERDSGGSLCLVPTIRLVPKRKY